MPEGHYTVPLGKAVTRREGSAVTILAYGTMVHVALAAAEDTGIDAEVIDLRTLVPLDLEAIVASVDKTGRCIVLHEATLTSGAGLAQLPLVPAVPNYTVHGAFPTGSEAAGRTFRADVRGAKDVSLGVMPFDYDDLEVGKVLLDSGKVEPLSTFERRRPVNCP